MRRVELDELAETLRGCGRKPTQDGLIARITRWCRRANRRASAGNVPTGANLRASAGNVLTGNLEATRGGSEPLRLGRRRGDWREPCEARLRITYGRSLVHIQMCPRTLPVGLAEIAAMASSEFVLAGRVESQTLFVDAQRDRLREEGWLASVGGAPAGDRVVLGEMEADVGTGEGGQVLDAGTDRV